MGKSFTISADASKGRHKFRIIINEVSVSGNSTKINWDFRISPIRTSWDWNWSNPPVNYTIIINGNVYQGGIAKYDGYADMSIRSGTLTINHNDDGTKNMAVEMSVSSLGYDYLPGDAYKKETITLTPIARHASLLTAEDVDDASNPTITYTNPAGNAIEDIQCMISIDGNQNNPTVGWRRLDKNATSYTFVLTDAEIEALNKNTNGDMCNYQSISYFFWSKIGGQGKYQKVDRYYYVTESRPRVSSVTIRKNPSAPISNLTNDDTIIKSHNSIYVTMMSDALRADKTPTKWGTIKRNEIRCGDQIEFKDYPFAYGQNYTTTFSTVLFNVNDSAVGGITYDWRDGTNYNRASINMIDYIEPTCNLVCKPKLDPTSSKASIDIDISGNYYNSTFGKVNNNLEVYFRTRIENAEWGPWIKVTDTQLQGNTYKANYNLTNFDYREINHIQAYCQDAVCKIEGRQIISNEYVANISPVFDWGKNDFNFNVPIKYKNENMFVMPNDVITYPSESASFSGFITSDSTKLIFTIPVNKPIIATGFDISGTVIGRGVNGYINGTLWEHSSIDLDDTIYTVTNSIVNNNLTVEVLFSSAIENSSNNTPVSITPNGDITITFK